MGDVRTTLKVAAWHTDDNLQRGAGKNNTEFETVAGSLIAAPEWTAFGQHYIAKRNGKFYFYNNTSKDVTIDVANYATNTVDSVSLGKHKVKLIEDDYM
jgi:hypothetical protein